MEQLAARKAPLPEWFLEEPQLERGESLYLLAFRHLTTERRWAQGPIPHSLIEEWGERQGLESSIIELLVMVILDMDDAYMRWNREEAEKAARHNRRSRDANRGTE